MIDSTGIYFITCIFAPQPEIMKPLMILFVLTCTTIAAIAQSTADEGLRYDLSENPNLCR